MSRIAVLQIAICGVAAFQVLFLHHLAREVNRRLAELGRTAISRRQYGWNVFTEVLREHERLFPESSKRTWWVLIFALSVFALIIAEFA